jgi:geranylgeranylglycerol-phosphate geranylgeranyltransferase
VQPYSSPFRKIIGLLTMMRLPNCFMIGFAVIVGEVIASPAFFYGDLALYGFLTGFFLLAASMVLNDYFDREIDAINDPQRPLPSGLVRPTEAISFAIILVSLGMLFASRSQSPTWTLLIAVASVAIMILYNAKAKKSGLIGNALVSTNIAIPFVYGGFAIANPTWSLGIFAALAFLSGLGREVIKGIADVTGDTARSVKSVAVTRGKSYAAREGAALFIGAVALSGLPLVLKLVSNYYVPLVAICDIGFLLTAYSIATNPSPRNAERSKKFVLIWMTFGLLAFLIGTL